MSKSLKSISSSNSLEYYFDENNIRNQKLVNETFTYFDKGEGKRAYNPLALLNLLDKQYHFVVDEINNPNLVIESLKKLPLTEERKHVLFGLILKWFGGYPVNNMNEQFDTVLKLIQKEFLSYERDTPEKEFCKADAELRNKLMKLSITGTTAINTGLDWKMLYDSIDEKKEKIYRSFDDLFNDFANNGYLGSFQNETVRLIERSRLNYGFNVWLQNSKGWEYGNSDQYCKFLSKEIFNEYLMFEKAEQAKYIFINNISSEVAFRVFSENYSKLRDRFRIKRKATKADCNEIPLLKEGDIISYEPEYTTTIEAYSLLINYYSVAYFELEKASFVEKYKSFNAETIKAEIGQLELFINESGKENLSNACDAYGKFDKDNDRFVYKRLLASFYENLEIAKYPSINVIGNIEARVYGRYFLFYEFLKSEFQRLNPKKNQENNLGGSGMYKRSKLDFTKTKLRSIILDLANLNGYEKPSTYLNELLADVKLLDSFEFECDFFLNIHYLCKENTSKFWSEGHKNDILNWLKKAPFIPMKLIGNTNRPLFETTWENDSLLHPEVKAPVIALFCNLVNESSLIAKGENEAVGAYCKRICEKYNLNYTDRVRQGFSTSSNKTNFEKVNNLILVNLNEVDKKHLTDYSNKKNQK